MFKRLLFIGVLFALSQQVSATDKLIVNFDLKQEKSVRSQGNVLVTSKLTTWNKGLRSSYVQLKCRQLENGKTEKLFSSIDYFDGLKVTHQMLNDEVELTVVHSRVKPQAIEIHKLPDDECKDMSPIVTTTVETYKFMAKKGLTESYPFGKNMTFSYSLN
ncbi:hypothetical protein [Colwellia sp. Bg11-12]|uniref:hypothetical protein n=1 Tax=Colwellia sp. Bg11-12 TaxID=2759817 RepID=UPI0015F6FC89|nr:hypothetical protein [Colwellia sp. Bg11-12]MBA6262342.1 hypothetical protein [Colwellia sp. Bg11-12]